VVARRQQSAATLLKRVHTRTISWRQAVATVDTEKPHLVELGITERSQHRIVAVRVGLTIAGNDGCLATQLFGQEREAPYVPVVFRAGDRALQQQSNHSRTLPLRIVSPTRNESTRNELDEILSRNANAPSEPRDHLDVVASKLTPDERSTLERLRAMSPRPMVAEVEKQIRAQSV
jgi:hypothetical protein